jgi:hypothetical protein
VGYHDPDGFARGFKITIPRTRISAFCVSLTSASSRSPPGVVAIACSRPIVALEYQTARHRIAVHVAEFRHALLFGEHNEIVEAVLPDVALEEGEPPQARWLEVSNSANSFQKTPSKGRFEDFHHHRWIATLGFAKQWMTVLGVTT